MRNHPILMEEVVILEPKLLSQPLIIMCEDLEDPLEMTEHQQQILRQQDLKKPRSSISSSFLCSRTWKQWSSVNNSFLCEHVEDQYQV